MDTRHAVERMAVLIAVAALLVSGSCGAQEAAATFAVDGKALKPDGSPAASALVEARAYSRETDWRVDATATAGADGKFAMQLPRGDYRFFAVLGNLVYLDRSEMINIAADGKPSKPIVLRLEKGCKVDGTVVDSSNGQPVGGVKIVTRDGDHAESDSSGLWSMVVHRERQAVAAAKDGYWWPIVNFSATGDTAKVKIEIKPGGTIKGRVIDEHGNAIADARVGTENSGHFRLYSARTDAEGRFTLGGLDPESQARISASADGYDSVYDKSVTFPSGQREAEVELTLKATKVRTITGRVTRPDGSPVEGVTVAYGAGPNWADYTSIKTDRDGNYTLDNAGIRRNLVVVTGEGLAPVCKPVEADKDARIDFQVKPSHTVEGCVEDEDGNPLSGVSIYASMDARFQEATDNMYGTIAGATTDKDGKFKLRNLPEGVVYADVYLNGYDGLTNERLKVDRKDYTLVLRKEVPGQICGTVVKDSDGRPVPEFNVRLGFAGPSSGLSPALMDQGVSFQDGDGRFLIKGLKVNETFEVIISAPGYMKGSASPIAVTPVSEADYSKTVIRLKPAGAFEGSVTEAGTGKPIEGVMVAAWDTGRQGTSGSFNWDMSHTSLQGVSTRTGADGKFRFDSMPFAFGMIMLEKKGFARTMLRQVSFSRPLQVSLEKGATITGTIADEQGKVPPGAWVNIWQVDLFLEFRAQIEADGSFSVDDLPPGEFLVLQYKDNRSTRRQSLELAAGEARRVDWVQTGEVIVEGKVLQNGKPLPHAQISANSRKRGMNWAGSAESGEDGSYKLTIFKPGEYSFRCMLGDWVDPNHIRSARTVTLAAGVNKLDFNMPCASISGKLVHKATGKPVANTSVRLYSHETYEQHVGGASLYWSAVEPTWWPANECKTDGAGSFQVKNLRAGEWMVCAQPGGGNSEVIPAAIIKLADGEAKSGIVARLPETGSAEISIPGMKDLPRSTVARCVDGNGFIYYPGYDRAKGTWLTTFETLPVGELKAVVESDTYKPGPFAFKVRPDETAKIPVKLVKGSRIIFRPKGESPDQFSLGFRITSPDGKPVWRTHEGLCWGGVELGTRADGVSLVVEPGKYLVKAAVGAEHQSWGGEEDLTGWSGTIDVVADKDTVIEVPWILE